MKQTFKISYWALPIIGLLFYLSTSSLFAQNQTEKAAKIEDLMSLYHEYDQFNGSVLVAENGKVIYKGGQGLANMEWEIPNEANTKHRLGSITKQFTGMLIMQLVEQGKLSLDGKITDYLPDYPKETGDKITLHHLLTHSSGIFNYTNIPTFFSEQSRDPYTPEGFLSVFQDLELQFEPGAQYSYSNSGYFLLGVIIEKVTGKTYEAVLKEQIFDPLGMNDTGFDHHSTILKNRATGYEKNGPNYINSPYLDMSIPYAAGSMYSTVEDLYLWDQALYTEKLLSKKNRDLIFTPHIPDRRGDYGYGWIIGKQAIGSSTDSTLMVGHGGGINGFNTLITRLPTEKHLVVLLNNTGRTNLMEMAIAINGILYGKEYNSPKKSLANSLLTTIMEQGLSSGLAFFNKEKESSIYSLDEYEMNNLGYQFLQTGKVKEAIEVFKLNVEAFPKSGNVYDSLGEAYLADGNTELAIKNYSKSVEIDPNNTYGKEVLEKLGVKK